MVPTLTSMGDDEVLKHDRQVALRRKVTCLPLTKLRVNRSDLSLGLELCQSIV